MGKLTGKIEVTDSEYLDIDMKSGENGVHLTVLIEGNPISETLMLNLSEK